MAETIKKRIYCAIYTRKSTSEGLDQDFTSLDAQRESGENFIRSQKNEGWVLLSDKYDDGGFTGANIERPALQKLVSDIKDGRVNCVVVYKVDRLSRSLLDFVQLLQLFDESSVTFVSVTQAFNTNSSMGRLTLNILLSFGQFEREIISERVRDKMGAARKKGKYLGGVPMLGYDIDRVNHKLLINDKESVLVREIFGLYVKEQSLLAVTKVLNEKGCKTKKHISKAGNIIGDILFTKNTIQNILRSDLYIGKVKYQGQVYQGAHDRIVSDEVFAKVQEILTQNCQDHTGRKRSKSEGLLNRIIRCKTCDAAMFHTYSQKGKYRYRYYVCLNAQKRGYDACSTKSISAPVIEDAVLDSLRKMSKDITLDITNEPNAECIKIINDPVWDTIFPQEKRRILRLILKEVDYNGTTGAFGLTLSENGMRFLNKQIQG